LRNAVGLAFFPSLDGGALFATNMGADHLGNVEPEETFFELDSNDHPSGIASSQPDDYGWPTCYFAGGSAHADPLVSAPKPTDHIFPPAPAGPRPQQFDCEKVPAAYNTFAAHSSPLGLEYFDASNPLLTGSFLVALHGAGHPQIGTGYRVVRFTAENRRPEDFITGFLINKGGKPVVKGRPCGLLRIGTDSFLLTDDLDGVVYSIHPR
jgi:glucose/arabinose dehydrogenase